MLQFITRWSRVLVATAKQYQRCMGATRSSASIPPAATVSLREIRRGVTTESLDSAPSPAHSAARREATESLHSIPSPLKVPPLCRLNPVSGPTRQSAATHDHPNHTTHALTQLERGLGVKLEGAVLGHRGEPFGVPAEAHAGDGIGVAVIEGYHLRPCLALIHLCVCVHLFGPILARLDTLAVCRTVFEYRQRESTPVTGVVGTGGGGGGRPTRRIRGSVDTPR